MENKNFLGEAPKASLLSLKLKLVFAALLSVALIVGGVFYFTYNQEEDTPPTLLSYEDNPSLFQGFIKQQAKDLNKGVTYSLVGFDQADKDAYAVNFAAWKATNENPIQVTKDEKNGGMVLVYSNEEQTFKEVAERIGPEAGAFVIASYQGDQKWRLLQNNKWTAPPEILEVVKIDKMADTKIPAGQAFIVGVLGNTQIFLNDKSVAPKISFPFCEQTSKGWHLGALRTTNIEAELKECLNAVESVWEEVDWFKLPDGKYSNFKKVEDFTAPLTGHIVWVKFKEAPNEVIADRVAEIAECPYSTPTELVNNLVDGVVNRDLVKIFRQLQPTDQALIKDVYSSIDNVSKITQLSKIAGIAKRTALISHDILKDEALVEQLSNLLPLVNVSSKDLLTGYIEDKKDILLTAEYSAVGFEIMEKLFVAKTAEAFLKNLSEIVVELEKEQLPKLKDSKYVEFKEFYENYKRGLAIIDVLKYAKVSRDTISEDGNTAEVVLTPTEGHDKVDNKIAHPLTFELIKAEGEGAACDYWTYPGITDTLETMKGTVDSVNHKVIEKEKQITKIADLIVQKLPSINTLFEKFKNNARVSDLVIGLAEEYVNLVKVYNDQEVEFNSYVLEADAGGHIVIEGYEPENAFGPIHGNVVEVDGKWYYVPDAGYEGDDFIILVGEVTEADEPVVAIPGKMVRAKKGTTSKRMNVAASKIAADPKVAGQTLVDDVAENVSFIDISAVGLVKIKAYSIETKGVVAPDGVDANADQQAADKAKGGAVNPEGKDTPEATAKPGKLLSASPYTQTISSNDDGISFSWTRNNKEGISDFSKLWIKGYFINDKNSEVNFFDYEYDPLDSSLSNPTKMSGSLFKYIDPPQDFRPPLQNDYILNNKSTRIWFTLSEADEYRTILSDEWPFPACTFDGKTKKATCPATK